MALFGTPEKRRQAARVVLLDPQGRVFLQHAHDPWNPSKGTWWELPGGGIDRGETSAETAARELWEEAGIRVTKMGPEVWHQDTEFTFSGLHFFQTDHIHVAWAEGGEWKPQHLELLEAGAFTGARWWVVDDLLASNDQTFPMRLREVLPALVAGAIPDTPIDITPA